MSSKLRIAVLLTCYNRAPLTRKCLLSLKNQNADVLFQPYLVDDGSSDNTTSEARSVWPDIHIIAGNGNLWWNGGMRLAWQTAHSSGKYYDFFLWLNDDVELFPNAIHSLLDDAHKVRSSSDRGFIIAGAVQDPTTGEQTYGGQNRTHARRPLRYKLSPPVGTPTPCDVFSGNCVLVSSEAFQKLGNLSPSFKHTYGDLDYSLRAHKSSVGVYSSSEFSGTCAGNSHIGTHYDQNSTLVSRLLKLWKHQRSIHGTDWRAFTRLHSGLGPANLLYEFTPYVRIIFGSNRPCR